MIMNIFSHLVARSTFRNSQIAFQPVLMLAYVLMVGVLYPLSGQLNHQIAHAQPASFADTIEPLLPSVVNIQATATVSGRVEGNLFGAIPKNSPFGNELLDQFRNGQRPRQAQAQGSGFVIDAKKGHIITNNHVVEDATEILVITQDGTELMAELVGRDPKTDLAVLKVKPSNKLKQIKWADSDKARVGDWVLAIGNPLGLGGTVTTGIISARGRDIRSGPYDDYIQTDASINRGNSGGPLFNVQGEVLGINTAIYSSNGGSIGIAFAIPTNLARQVIDQLIRFGETKRGWLGVFIQEVTDEIAEGVGLKQATGAMVSSVQDKSPASDAGIQAGDVILEFNGTTIESERILQRVVASIDPNKTVSIKIWRDRKKITLHVKLGRLETANNTQKAEESKTRDKSSNAVGTKLTALNVRVAPLNDQLRNQYKIADSVPNGLLVLDTLDGTGPSENSLFRGMVITQINQQDVTTANKAKGILKQAAKDRKQAVLVRFYFADGSASFVGVKLKK